MLPRVKVKSDFELLFSINIIIRPLSWAAEAAVTHVADGRAQFEKKTSYFNNWRVCRFPDLGNLAQNKIFRK